MTPTFHASLRAAAAAFVLLAASAAAQQPIPAPGAAATWRAECGGCHVAFPPRLLTAEDWRAVMGRLDRHYGSDASADAAVASEIGEFLDAHAGRRPGGRDGPLPRITTGRWFAKEHRKVAPATFESQAVKSPANCAACHRNAAQGDFDEHDVHIPRWKDQP